jgi:two-component system, chemotaxis family, sensor kinase CheA
MDLARYAALFVAESREHLRACNTLLIAWEREPAAAEPVGGLFRAMHSIKGMAATMGHAQVADVAHHAESLLDAIRGGRVAVRPEYLDLLFRAVDTLEDGVEAAATGKPATEANAEVLLRALEVAAAGAAAREPAPLAGAEQATGALLDVEVVVRPGTPLRGARAALALRRVEAVGTVSRVTPATPDFERDDFDGRFGFRLRTGAAPREVDAALRSAGDIANVAIDIASEDAALGADLFRQVRVDVRRLDAMTKLAGELVVGRNRLLDLLSQHPDGALRRTAEAMGRQVGELQAELLAARMTPVAELFDRFPRVVRDLARDLGRRVRLETEGGDIEVDRAVLEELGDPLVHLVRNAIDHGIEPPAVRVAAGKPPEGRLWLVAARERNSVVIRVHDDGRGVDRARVLQKAREAGVAESGLDALGDDQLLRMLARSGLSTATAVSGVSGRGVGVDVVVTRLRALGGTVELTSRSGEGTAFTLRVPLTLAIVSALLVRVGGERYAVPLAYVAETVDYEGGRRAGAAADEVLEVRGRAVPTVHLGRLFAVPGAGAIRRPAVVLQVGGRSVALVVDALEGQQDIVVEPFVAPVGTPPWFGGATILADGQPALILDAAALA